MAVSQDFYRDFLIDKAISGIQEKMPFIHGKKLYIQQENARLHVPYWDEKLYYAVNSIGWKASIKNQPPNSPD